MNASVKFKSRVSSTINKDVKNFGKQFMFDGNDETCWNSDEGEIQWIQFLFDSPIKLSNLGIQFQGGFAAESGVMEILNEASTISEKLMFENNNLFQNVKLSQCYEAQNIKILFNKSFDTYGRIIVYHLILNEK